MNVLHLVVTIVIMSNFDISLVRTRDTIWGPAYPF